MPSTVTGGGPPAVVASWLLAGLGAIPVERVTVERDRAGCDLDVGRPADVPGLPTGIGTYVQGLAVAAAALLTGIGGRLVRADRTAALDQLMLPERLGGAAPAPPSAPLPIGSGAVQAQLDADDRDLLDALVASLGDAARDPEAVAAIAQDAHLPVTPYRRALPPDWPDFPVQILGATAPGDGGAGPADAEPAGRDAPLAGVTVVDLTAMWAGPLCTSLLAVHGATVHKVEPDCRPDGLRGGRGPGGRPAPMFVALNAGKRRSPWDLRRPDHRERFEALVRRTDLFVDSFSPRVLPNFGYHPEALWALNPSLIQLSLPALPHTSAQRHWIAYGPGVHAMSGLGWDGDRYCAPRLAYPDPVAGSTAFVAALAGLLGRARRGWVGRLEVSLAAAVAPLGTHPACGRGTTLLY